MDLWASHLFLCNIKISSLNVQKSKLKLGKKNIVIVILFMKSLTLKNVAILLQRG